MSGDPAAAHAPGQAKNGNPLSIPIPRHRVIGAHGDMVDHAEGVEVERELPEMERYDALL